MIIITTGRWYALAPLGPFTSRAYRLIEISFACVFCPTTADAVIYAAKKDWGREFVILVSLPPSSPNGESTSLIRGRLAAAAGLGIAKAFWNHTLPVVFFIQKNVRCKLSATHIHIDSTSPNKGNYSVLHFLLVLRVAGQFPG